MRQWLMGAMAAAVLIALPAEAKLKSATMVVDAETGELRELEVTPRLALAYVQAWKAHAEELERFCGRYDVGYVQADAAQPFEDIVLKAFRQGRFVA